MIIKSVGKCQVSECKQRATHVAVNVLHGDGMVGMYCEQHAMSIVDAGMPEYVVVCPNCDCIFGCN